MSRENTVLLADHVPVNVGETRRHTKLEAIIRVGRCYYLGPLPIKMTGFRDEQEGSLSTTKMVTDFIEPARIERGEMSGWVQLPTDKEIAITFMMGLSYVDALPENPDDLARQLSSSLG